MGRMRLGQAGLAITLLMLVWSTATQVSTTTANSAQPAMTAYKGSGSCSAVACHGGIAPLGGSSVMRNEHTTWISDDKHSRAFQVLFDDRSKQIAENLAGKNEPVPAHQDKRCLACHTTPRLEPLLTATAWMNQDAVGCESCHGCAEKWLGSHTTDNWKRFSSADKQELYGFTNTKNLVRRIELCAGCHVGQDARDELPLRDVNHDLIAAGHPRLIFEYAAYQENQPAHWDKRKPAEPEAAADFPARAWAVGQLVSARAALSLLASRSTRATKAPLSGLPPALPGPAASHSPWPEFAEYGCFSCHHSLADEPWRRNRTAAGISLGVPAWGSWYFPLTAPLLENAAAGDLARVKEVDSAIKSLTDLMSRPLPDPALAKRMADKGTKALDAIIEEFSSRPASSFPVNIQEVERLIEQLNRPGARSKIASWDEAAQRYLALVPLNQARLRLGPGRQAEYDALSGQLRAFLNKLTFPKGFDSPRGFDPGRIPGGEK
jgi:hypothetical protein